MKHHLKYNGTVKATGSRIACEYALQRLSKQPAEQALETGLWTIDPVTTKIVTKQSKMNQWTNTDQKPE
jgi:hypothetical protein